MRKCRHQTSQLRFRDFDFSPEEAAASKDEGQWNEVDPGSTPRSDEEDKFLLELSGLASVLVELSYHGDHCLRTSLSEFSEDTVEVATNILHETSTERDTNE